MNQVNLETEKQLSDLDRAAILLLSMGEDNAANVIRQLNIKEVRALSQRMAKISNISQEEMSHTLVHFFDCYRHESGVSGASRRYLEKALDKAVGRKLARNMLDEIYGGSMADELRRLEWIPPELIARFLEQEHAQMQALLLALLPADQASSIIALLPKEKHEDLLYRIANLREVSEHVIDDLRYTLEACIEYVSEQVGAKLNGVEKVAEIVNRYNGNKGEIIGMLKQHSQETAEAVEARMFDFVTLKNQTDEVLAFLVNEIPDELWIVALKGADQSLIDCIMGALPKRLSQVYQQQIDNLGPQPVSKVEAARADIMSMIKEMMDQNSVEYRLYQEEVLE